MLSSQPDTLLPTAAASSAVLLNQPQWWDRVSEILVALSHLANIGIVIAIIQPWLPFLATVGHILGPVTGVADPLIYVLKTLNSLWRLALRHLGYQLVDEPYGHHRWQLQIDSMAIVCFVLAVVSFLGVMAAGPLGPFLGWVFGLSGMMMFGYSHEYTQYRLAEKEYEQAKLTYPEDSSELKDVEKHYLQKRREWVLCAALLAGLTVLLLCSTAAVFAPPAVVPILLIAYKIASVYLIGLNVCRLGNWVAKKAKGTAVGNAANKAVSACNKGLFEAAKKAVLSAVPDDELQPLAAAPSFP